ncbi:helix-turn-helix transcriptional regulator [Heliobacterium chlorum]|uniref:Helix-turn-helix transcriptional regulator n=1 Tax=Heliobacterium chlorum TaxID=2698 RepID=A0ABR7T0J1_HELCL|nr:helix-turn-helix transcriptional regulator [Heliobacterium chlorum]MBC9783488.1 helix-turn-helix transcriptional regulator [Heliobacterium chlorum]
MANNISMQFDPSALRLSRHELGAFEGRTITQGEFGQRMNPPRSASRISQWENGKEEPEGQAVAELCRVTGKPINFFYKPRLIEQSINQTAEMGQVVGT